jgi:endonuclease/exonuclease/phosphatase family metal-dependent hydrolase
METGSHIFVASATARGVLAAALALVWMPAFALDAGETLRVMTFNVRGCTDETGVRNVAQTANRILAEDPDVCGIQECNAARSAELAAATGLKLFFANDECILSKTEPLSTEVVDLQYYKFYKRILMIAEFDDYIIANTHMSRTSEYGLLEVDVITNALAKYEGKGKPVLFMGDINTRPGFYVDNKLTPLMQCISPRRMAVGEGTYHSEMNAEGQYTWEWILDFIYMDFASARSGEWSWTSHVVKDHITSDHAPVVADITCRRIKKRENARAWIDEEAHTAGLTGTWSDEVVYDWQTFAVPLAGRYAFTPNKPSRGQKTTVEVTVAFSEIPAEEETLGEDVQGAVWIGTNGCFQVWVGNVANVEMLPMANSNVANWVLETGTGNNGNTGNIPRWIDVEAEGVTPQTGVEYTFRIAFNYSAGTYSAYVKTGLTGFTRLREKNPVNLVNPVQNFPLAASCSALTSIGFDGDGILRSIFGNYVSGFNVRLR